MAPQTACGYAFIIAAAAQAFDVVSARGWSSPRRGLHKDRPGGRRGGAREGGLNHRERMIDILRAHAVVRAGVGAGLEVHEFRLRLVQSAEADQRHAALPPRHDLIGVQSKGLCERRLRAAPVLQALKRLAVQRQGVGSEGALLRARRRCWAASRNRPAVSASKP